MAEDTAPATYDVLKASQGEDPWGVLGSEGVQYAAQLEGHRRGKFREFFALVDKYDLQTGDILFEANPEDSSGDGRDPFNTEKLIEEKPAPHANSFSSRIRRIVKSVRYDANPGPTIDYREPTHDEKHLPIFDIDFPVLVIPSSTPGHNHLIIDRPMSESHYMSLLNVMANVGIVQEGYQRASLKRKAAWLRTPWTKK